MKSKTKTSAMPVYKSTRHNWIMGYNKRHVKAIEQMTSQEQLIKEDDGEPGHCFYDSISTTACQVTKDKDADHADKRDSLKYFQIQEPANQKDRGGVSCKYYKHAFKNLVVLGLGFMLLFTSFVSSQSLQSSINAHQGVGLASLSCAYGATVISCLFAPALIGKLTTKWTIVTGYFVYMVYFISNWYPEVYVMIPSSLALGLFTGPLWSAQATYLTTLAIGYAQVSQQLRETTITVFTGIFFSIYQTSQIWGHMLSAGVLSNDNTSALHMDPANISNLQLFCASRDCGAHHAPLDNSPGQVIHVTPKTRFILLAVHVAFSLVSILITSVCLDKNEVIVSNEKYSVSITSHELLFATTQIWRDSRLLALMPLVLYTGLELGFIMGDFTKSYVSCPLGVHKVGLVMVCFGTVNAMASISIGHVAKHIKRYPIMVAGTLFSTGLMMVLLWWTPSPKDQAMFFVISGCLGLCDAIWQTQSNALFGVLFSDHQEAAFASYRIFQSIGFAVAFGYSYFLCVSTKVYILAGVLVVALVFYSALEFQVQQRKKIRRDIVIL